MERRDFLKHLGLTTGAIALASAPAGAKAKAEKPNFVFVIGDDCTYRDLACYGGQAHTPNLDQLAQEGMRFTHCFQAAPMCAPTRQNLYTGLYPVKSGAYPNHSFVKTGVQSIAHYLKPAGYRVALSGKSHVSPKEAFPFEYSGIKKNPDFNAIEKLFKESKEKENPFCLFVCSNEPHSPWDKGDVSRYDPKKITLPPYFVDTEQTRQDYASYLAEVTYLDGQLGQCMALLDQHELSENTLLIFVSEQGAGFPFAKWTCYDSGVQSAFVARWPGQIEAGSVCDALIEYVDVTPTFVEAAGETPAEILDGKSLLPLLRGDTREHKDYVFSLQTSRGINEGPEHFGIRAVRSKRYKYVLNLTPETTFQNTCTTRPTFQSWIHAAKTDPEAAEKVRRYQHRPAEELYDIIEDPYEWENLAEKPEFAETKKELKTQLERWMKAQGDLGQQTEAEALAHQTSRKRSKRKAKK